jgi:aldehyde dehydrogenase (NAD+)
MSRRWHAFVDGAELHVGGAEVIQSVDPSTGDVLGEVDRGDAAAIDRAVESSKRAARAWGEVSPEEKGRLLTALSSAIRERADFLAELETLDTGKPLRTSRRDVEVVAQYFEFYGGVLRAFNGEMYPLGSDQLAYSVHEPFGVVAMIIGWNAPLQQLGRGAAPALAAGNAVVLKPAEDAPLSSLALAEVLATAGLAPGLLNVVPGLGEEAGAALVRHPDVGKVAFTGSVAVGRIVARDGAQRLVPVSLELGGKSPNLVFADADLDAAVQGAVKAICVNSGQMCSAGSRLLVDCSIKDAFVDSLAAAMDRLVIGPGLEDPDLGPIATARQLETVQSYLRAGVQEGAKLVYQGTVAAQERYPRGHYCAPAVFTEVGRGMRIAREEVFGPVLSVLTFDDEQQAVDIANDTSFGLVAGLWTTDFNRAHRVARQLQAGQVYINDWFVGGVETPFGGFKESGLGREKGVQALREYSQLKTIIARVSPAPVANPD